MKKPKGNAMATSPMSLVWSHKITTPVEYLDVPLVQSSGDFVLVIKRLGLDAENALGGAFSPDGGTNFYCDTIDYDSYQYNSASVGADDGVYRQNPGASDVTDSVMQFIPFNMMNGNGVSDRLAEVVVEIDPGGAHRAMTRARASYDRYNQATNPGELPWRVLEESANVLLEATGRQNLLRIAPYGNEDIAPPTSGVKITSGEFKLFHLPGL
jgi:hypothetical protein